MTQNFISKEFGPLVILPELVSWCCPWTLISGHGVNTRMYPKESSELQTQVSLPPWGAADQFHLVTGPATQPTQKGHSLPVGVEA